MGIDENKKVTDIINNLSDLGKQIEAAYSLLQRHVAKAIGGILDQSTGHKVAYVSFVGYTPHFNDGDICSYSVNNDDEQFYTFGLVLPDGVLVNILVDEMYEEEIVCTTDSNAEIVMYTSDLHVEELLKLATECKKVLSAVPEDFWRSLGEGRYKISGEGIEVVHIEHD